MTNAGSGSAAPRFDPGLVGPSSAFMKCSGFVLDEVGPARVIGHIDLSSDHHTPWGIVHGGVYSSAVETAASIGASAAVWDKGQTAVGLTNTTHFLRALSRGRANVEAVAIYQGRTHQLWRVDVTEAGGRLVASGEVRLQNIDAGRSLGRPAGSGNAGPHDAGA
jgi:1,4-dihydroxy-2-naphthoyl-CoA hydrolase